MSQVQNKKTIHNENKIKEKYHDTVYMYVYMMYSTHIHVVS